MLKSTMSEETALQPGACNLYLFPAIKSPNGEAITAEGANIPAVPEMRGIAHQSLPMVFDHQTPQAAKRRLVGAQLLHVRRQFRVHELQQAPDAIDPV